MLDFLHTVPLRSDFSSISFLWFHFCLIAKTPTKTENGLHQITGGYSMAWGVPGVPPLCIYSVFWGPPIRKQHYNQHPASRYQSVSNDHYASFVHCFMTPDLLTHRLFQDPEETCHTSNFWANPIFRTSSKRAFNSTSTATWQANHTTVLAQKAHSSDMS